MSASNSPVPPRRRFAAAALSLSGLLLPAARAAAPRPVLLGIDGEFGLDN